MRSAAEVLLTLIFNQFFSPPKQLNELTMKYTDSEGVPENVKEECCPGDPHILFFANDTRPVPLKLINVIPQNGLFTTIVNISDCPSVDKLIDKLRKELKLSRGESIFIVSYGKLPKIRIH